MTMAEPDAIVPAQGQPTLNDTTRKDSTPPDGNMVAKKRYQIDLRIEITSKTVNVHAATRKTVQALMEADPTLVILSKTADMTDSITATTEIPSDTKTCYCTIIHSRISSIMNRLMSIRHCNSPSEFTRPRKRPLKFFSHLGIRIT